MNSHRTPIKSILLNWASACFAWASAVIIVCAFVALIWKTVALGVGELGSEFLIAPPTDAGRAGGIGPMLVSTLLILAVCMLASLPVGIGTAIWLAEYSSRESVASRWVERALEILAGVPSILFGLFGNAFFCQALGMGFSILSGGLTLACMILPILIYFTRDGIRAVPDEYRRGAASLGLSRSTTLFQVLLPAAMPSIAAGLALGVGRAIAETAALIFTSGYVSRTPQSLFDSGRALSVHIYDLAMNVPGGNSRAFAAAIVLVTVLFVINLVSMALLRKASSGERLDLGRLGS